MNIELKEITPNNWRKVNSLKVKKDQKEFVLDNVGILARAFAYRKFNSKVYAIYKGETPIGLIMQRDYSYNNMTNCILDQVMVDKNYQGLGYGRLAIETWMTIIKNENIYDSIELCFLEGDFIAEKMYKKLGFIRKLESDDEDELVMTYKL